MLKTLARLASIALVGLLTSSCWVAGFGVKTVVTTAVVPAGPPGPPGPPGAQLPLIQLQYGGQSVAGLPSEYNWITPNSYWSGGSTWAPNVPFPGTLAAPFGKAITVAVSFTSPPTVVWVTELDKQGLPTASRVLTTSSNLTAYTPSQSGQYVLMVKALWAREQYMTYLFSVAIQP